MNDGMVAVRDVPEGNGAAAESQWREDDEGVRRVPQEVIDRMKTRHGALALLEIKEPPIEVLIKQPGREETSLYKKQAASLDAEKMAECAAELFFSVLLFPSVGEYARVTKHQPMAADVLGAKVLKIAGERQEVRVKKL